MSVPAVGDIYCANLPYEDYIQSGVRPVIVAQNSVGNKFSPIIHVIPLTQQLRKASSQPTHVYIPSSSQNGLKKDSVALVEDIRPVSQKCLTRKIGTIGIDERKKVGEAMRIQFPLVG